MNIRSQVLNYLDDNGASRRAQIMEGTGLDSQQLSGVLNVMIKKDCIIRHGEPRAIDTTFSVTDLGREYAKQNAHRHSTTPRRNGAVQPMEAPVLPNISVTAESLTDQISAVLAENSELRNALVDIRKRINTLLGEETIYFGEGSTDGEKHSDSHSH